MLCGQLRRRLSLAVLEVGEAHRGQEDASQEARRARLAASAAEVALHEHRELTAQQTSEGAAGFAAAAAAEAKVTGWTHSLQTSKLTIEGLRRQLRAAEEAATSALTKGVPVTAVLHSYDDLELAVANNAIADSERAQQQGEGVDEDADGEGQNTTTTNKKESALSPSRQGPASPLAVVLSAEFAAELSDLRRVAEGLQDEVALQVSE